MTNCCNQTKQLNLDFEQIQQNEKKTLLVVIITFVMMAVEVVAGYITQSMALLADGYHMASHAGALGIAYLVYKMARSEKIKNKLNFGTGKLLPLGGYTSAIGLAMISLWMIAESVERFLNPKAIQFNEAIGVAVLGLIANALCAWILGSGHAHHHHDQHHHDHDDHNHNHDHGGHHHHHHEVEDHNHRSAFLHVLADALTSVCAIVALVFGKYFNLNWLDPFMGILGALVIIRWAYSLTVLTGKELLDAKLEDFDLKKIKEDIEKEGAQVLDLHIWKIGPANHACQGIIQTQQKKGSQYYRQFLPAKMTKSIHLVIEEV